MAPPKSAAPAMPKLPLKPLLVPCLMMAFRFLKVDLSAYVLALRLVYCASTIVVVATFVYVTTLIRRKNEEATIEVTQPGASTPTKMSTADYDVSQCKTKIQQAVLGAVFIAFIHYKWGALMPLLFQSLAAIINLSDDPEIQIHLLGKPATGKLKRPFVNPIENFFNPTDATTAKEEKKSHKKTK